ncbi:MAG: hypothetical protein WC767_03665 [Candidatus Paceibacterota bacterium]|jgi:co-chaperonin GroES (HSP10)
MVTLLNGFILVKKVETEHKTGEIVTAQAIDDFTYRGQVVNAAGDLMGKVVHFRKDAGEELKLNGETLKAIKSEDIICYE